MNITPIKKALSKLGFTQNEQDLYQILLEQPKFSVTKIAQHFKVERITVYRMLDKLAIAGLLKKTQKNKRATYIPNPPNTVLGLLKKDQATTKNIIDQVGKILPEVQFLFNQKYNIQKIKVYQQEEDYINLLHEFVDEANGFIYWIGSIDILKFLPTSTEKAIQERIAKGVISKWIVFYDREYALRDHKAELRENRWLNVPEKPEATIIAYGNKIAIWNTVYLKIIVIEDQLIFNLFKIIFEMLWSHLSEKQKT